MVSSYIYNTIISKSINFIPNIPKKNKFKINVIKTELPGIVTIRKTIEIDKKIKNWKDILEKNNLCHLCVIERHGKSGDYSHGFIQNFNLKEGAVASSVGHDAHNIIVAGRNETDMKYALKYIKDNQGAIVIVKNKKIISNVKLPIAGLLSDMRASEVAKTTKIFKDKWNKSGYYFFS